MVVVEPAREKVMMTVMTMTTDRTGKEINMGSGGRSREGAGLGLEEMFACFVMGKGDDSGHVDAQTCGTVDVWCEYCDRNVHDVMQGCALDSQVSHSGHSLVEVL